MKRTLLKSKLHKARVTGADLHYEGSITIDRELMKEADFLPYEQVDIYNITNGNRFTTYVIEGEKGDICLNGAAARLVQAGDQVIIASYAEYDDTELKDHHPIKLLMNDDNSIKEKISDD